MDRQQIQEIIFRVLSECRDPAACLLPLDIPVEVSARHVHLTGEAVERLFGRGAKLTPKRPLSQPGQFLSEERVTIVTPKGRIENVAVLGPERLAVQTELSATDCRTLGIRAPLRMSGELGGAADVYLVGPAGMIEAKNSAIVARAHIHITPPQAEKIGITDGQQVAVTLPGQRPMTLEHVVCRVSSQAALAMHIDYDEANACLLPANAVIRMRVAPSGDEAVGTGIRNAGGEKSGIKNTGSERTGAENTRSGNTGGDIAGVRRPAEMTRQAEADGCTNGGFMTFEGKLITEAVARKLAAAHRSPLSLAAGVIVTPSAGDVLRHAGIEILRQTGR